MYNTYKRRYKTSRKYPTKTRGRFTRRKTARTFQARVKKVLMKTTEMKYLTGSAENQQLYHDVGLGTGPTTNQHAVLFNPWVNITKGDTVSQRTGDEVYARGMAVRLWLANKLDRPNTMYRIMIAKLPKYYGGVLTNGSNVDLFQTASGGNTMSAMMKKEGFRVLYDKILNLQIGYSKGTAGDTFKEAHAFKKFYIRSKSGSKLKWMEDGTLANNPIGFWIIPYDSYATIQTDNIASCAFSYCLYFRDP